MHFQGIQEDEFFNFFSKSWRLPPITFRIFVDVTILTQALYNTYNRALCQKIVNGQKVLLIVVTRLLDLILKCIDNFKFRQLSVQSAIYMFKVSKKHYSNMSNIIIVNNKDTRTMSGATFVNFKHILHIILLLILLNLNKCHFRLRKGSIRQ